MASKEKVAELMAKLKGHEIVKFIPVSYWVGTPEQKTEVVRKLNQAAKQIGVDCRFNINDLNNE